MGKGGRKQPIFFPSLIPSKLEPSSNTLLTNLPTTLYIMHEFFGSIDKRKDQALGTMQLLSNFTIILIILFSAYLFTYLPKLNLKYLKYILHNIHTGIVKYCHVCM